MTIAAGTSGFSYKGWRGSFYPEDLPEKRWLAYYAERLPTVELNNTFYRMPKASVVETWAEQVPETFRFSIKASRRITHQKRLKDASDEIEYLLRVTGVLGPKLGALLFQLPPNLRFDRERLERFCDGLPPATPAAFEFRHESWRDEGAAGILAQRGFAFVHADTEESPQGDLPAQGPLLYLRLRREAYPRADLVVWAKRIAAGGAERSLVYFKHEGAGVGAGLARELLELVARSARRRSPRSKPGAAARDREAG